MKTFTLFAIVLLLVTAPVASALRPVAGKHKAKPCALANKKPGKPTVLSCDWPKVPWKGTPPVR